MPINVDPIQNPYRSIDKPCIDQVVRQLITEGVLIEPKTYIHTDRVFSNNKVVTYETRYIGDLSLTVEPISEMVEQADWSLKNRWEYMPVILADHELRIKVRPMLVDYQTVVRLVYTDDNLETLRLLRESLLIKRMHGWYGSSHTLDYTVIQSKHTDELLRTIHSLRESRYGYGHSFDEWVALCASPDYHPVVNGRHMEQAFNVRQVRIEGNIEGDIEQIEEYIEGAYSFALTYKFRYARPSALFVEYPIQIHQQLLPKKYTIITNSEHKGNAIYEVPAIKALTHVSDIMSRVPRIPSVDTEYVDSYPTGYLPLWTALLSLDDTPVDQQVLCNLAEIPDIMLHPKIVEYLQETHADLTTKFKLPFMLVMHRDNHLLDDRYLSVDADLNVQLDYDVNRRYVYRLSLCILRQLSALKADAVGTIIRHGVQDIISDTLNALQVNDSTHAKQIVLPSDFNSMTLLRVVRPIMAYWDSNARTISDGAVVTQKTIQSTWVTAERQ